MISYKPMSDKPSVRSPWFWVPSLYFAQGIPYVAVMIVSVLMYKRLEKERRRDRKRHSGKSCPDQ